MPPQTQAIFAPERPHPRLWTFYLIRSVLTGPAIILSLPLLYFRMRGARSDSHHPAAPATLSNASAIAVGTAVTGAPRADPYVKHYLRRLLP